MGWYLPCISTDVMETLGGWDEAFPGSLLLRESHSHQPQSQLPGPRWWLSPVHLCPLPGPGWWLSPTCPRPPPGPGWWLSPMRLCPLPTPKVVVVTRAPVASTWPRVLAVARMPLAFACLCVTSPLPAFTLWTLHPSCPSRLCATCQALYPKCPATPSAAQTPQPLTRWCLDSDHRLARQHGHGMALLCPPRPRTKGGLSVSPGNYGNDVVYLARSEAGAAVEGHRCWLSVPLPPPLFVLHSQLLPGGHVPGGRSQACALSVARQGWSAVGCWCPEPSHGHSGCGSGATGPPADGIQMWASPSMPAAGITRRVAESHWLALFF